MVATLYSIYCCEKSLSIQGIRARYRGGPVRGQNDKCVSQLAEYFRGGARNTEVFSRIHCAVHRCAADPILQPPHLYFRLGQELQLGVNVMQLVSYIKPILTSFHIHISL